MSKTTMSDQDERKKANLRLALILLTVVLVFFVGFMARMAWLGK